MRYGAEAARLPKTCGTSIFRSFLDGNVNILYVYLMSRGMMIQTEKQTDWQIDRQTMEKMIDRQIDG